MAAPAWYPKQRTALMKRLRDEDRVDAYIEAREGYKKKGVKDKFAWQVAGLMFPPLSPDVELEFEPDQEALDLFEQMGPIDTMNPPAVEVVKSNFKRYQRGGTDETQDKLMPVEKRRATWEQIAKEVPLERKAKPLEIAEWAFLRYMTPIEQISPDEVPDQGALGLLKHIRATPAAYSEFLRNLWSKLIPDRKQLDAQARFSDDGRMILNDLDAFDEDFDTRMEEQDAMDTELVQ